jgi:hypothetical protein
MPAKFARSRYILMHSVCLAVAAVFWLGALLKAISQQTGTLSPGVYDLGALVSYDSC